MVSYKNDVFLKAIPRTLLDIFFFYITVGIVFSFKFTGSLPFVPYGSLAF